jgi:hypothetical protein
MTSSGAAVNVYVPKVGDGEDYLRWVRGTTPPASHSSSIDVNAFPLS